MQTRLLRFIDALRSAGLQVTVAETLDAARATRISGIERAVFRDSLAATLVKDEGDRALFDAVFDRFFAMPKRERGKSRRRTDPAGNGQGLGDSGQRVRPASPQDPRRPASGPRAIPRPAPEKADRQRGDSEKSSRKLAGHRALSNKPFHDMSPLEVEECTALVAALAQRLRVSVSRRQRRARRGRIDLRRTLRRSTSTGGVPIDPAARQRRPRRPDLIALCDYSHSVVTASAFLLALITPADEFFRRVRLFAFVDQPVEVSLEAGVLIPHDQLDLYARSDFGAVLATFCQRYQQLLTRNIILLILGDARNNRRPPRADLLRRMRGSIRQIVWLNPEPRQRWDTGDSVMRSYAPHCDTLLSASTLRQLENALRQLLRRN